jgi:hypothetical protein
MVESVWWSDGLLGQSPPHPGVEVGEGWLVLGSKSAWEAIQHDLGTLMRSVHIERAFYKDGQSFKRHALAVQSVKCVLVSIDLAVLIGRAKRIPSHGLLPSNRCYSLASTSKDKDSGAVTYQITPALVGNIWVIADFTLKFE